jgi:hypothetical protein
MFLCAATYDAAPCVLTGTTATAAAATMKTKGERTPSTVTYTHTHAHTTFDRELRQTLQLCMWPCLDAFLRAGLDVRASITLGSDSTHARVTICV